MSRITVMAPVKPIPCQTFQTWDNRGAGLRICRTVQAGVLVIPYKGTLVKGKRAIDALEDKHAEAGTTGYIMTFRWRDVTWGIDATYSTHESRFINHSRRHANLEPVLIQDPDNKDVPLIFFKSKREIKCGEELLFDYGDNRPHAVADHPWLLE